MSTPRRTDRRNPPVCWIALVLALPAACGFARARAAEPPTPIAALIHQAGNAESDTDRLRLLKQLHARPDLNKQLKADTAHLIAAVEQWTTSRRLPYFGREVSRTKDYDFKIGKQSPLWPITCIYRGRMLVWVTLESGNIIRYSNVRRQYLDRAAANFRAAKAAFGDNRVIRMYLGEPIPSDKQYASARGAPRWAALQRENIERLADVIEWWIDHRMQPDSQYGGGWGDDCEMWRWWTPVLIGFDSPKITAAQARFSAALMAQKHMKGGYTSRMTDVEHTAEDSADVITPMMHLAPNERAWKERAMRLADLMEKLWTGRNEKGQFQYKSTYFTVDRVDSSPQRACDTVYHPRAVQPALLLWQRTGDKRLTKLFSAWMDTWVAATARAERGKPAGIIPSAIHWPDGRVGGLGEHWWDPRNHGEPTLYRWPSAMKMMVDTLLLTWHMTGDRKYLAPLRSMAAARLRYLRDPPAAPPQPGSEAWCARQLGFLAATLAKHKRLTGSKEFDELLKRDGRAMATVAGGADRSALEKALLRSAKALRINWPGYTSEVRYTDRVLRFPALFGADMMFLEPVAGIEAPKAGLLYSTVTGDPGGGGYFPLNAVRWLTPPRDIAALVTQTGSDRFAAELFHFGDRPRKLTAELYLLAPGRYTLQIAAKEDQPPPAARAFDVTGRTTRVPLELPPRTLCTLRIRRSGKENDR